MTTNVLFFDVLVFFDYYQKTIYNYMFILPNTYL